MKIILSAILSFLFALSAFAQSPSKILSQAEKAMGGSKALKAIRATRRSGNISRQRHGGEGKYALQISTPNLLHISFDLGGFETEIGYNGRSGWTRNSRDGVRRLTGIPSLRLAAAAAYRNYLWLRYKDEKAKLTYSGRGVIDGRAVNSILLSTPKGASIRLSFDAVSGLLIRDEVPMGEDVYITDYSDHRRVSGVMQPFFERITIGGETYEIRHDHVGVNEPIAVSEFNFPPLSGEPLPDITTLLKEVQANEDQVESLIDKYSFVQKSIKRELGKDGILRETGSETVQISFYKGRRISRLIEKNGRPLSPSEQADADKDAAKRVEEIEKEIAKEDAKMLKQEANVILLDEPTNPAGSRSPRYSEPRSC